MDTYDQVRDLEMKLEKFYRELSENVVNPSLKMVMEKLADDQKEHLHLIDIRAEHIVGTEKMEDLTPRPHAFDYLKAYEFEAEDIDHKALYHQAHEMESELVMHYQKMLEASQVQGEKNLLDLLLKQEEYHIEVIDELYNIYTEERYHWK